MKHLVLAGMLLASATLFSCDKDDDTSNMGLSSTDRTFVTGAAIGNTAEIQAGQLAATKATNEAIKAFGEMMVAEHGMAQSELKTLANKLGVVVADTVDAQHKTLMEQLNSLSGHEFDSVYINNQVLDHQKTVNLFQTQLSDGDNDSLKTYASKYLPNIQMHLTKADSLSKAF